MNRRHLLRNVGVAGLGPGLASSLLASASASEGQGTAARPDTPAAYAPRPDGATIVWAVDGPSIGWVEYGEAGTSQTGRIARADGSGFIPHGDRVVRVRLQGLAPGKSYWYRTHTRPAPSSPKPAPAPDVRTSPTYTLTLPNPDAKETHFCIWNDTHDHPETLTRLAELTQAEPFDFLFWNGDVSNNINEEAQIPGLYLRPRGGVDLARGPAILFARGNHDVRGPYANRLSEYIDFPDRKPYYSFRSGPVAAIVLDTGEDKPDDHPSFLGLVDFEPLIREQALWLADEIEKPHLKDAPFKVVFCHIPLRWRNETAPNYATGGFDHFSRRGRDAWQPALARWGAQIVVSGHTHQPHHMPATSEFPFEQLIGGGPKLDVNASLIRVHADQDGLTFRRIAAKDGREAFRTTLKPLA